MFRLKRCREISQLISEARERNLTWLERIAVRFHRAICKPCDEYTRQLDFLHKSGSAMPEDSSHIDNPALSDEARRRIIEKLGKTDTD